MIVLSLERERMSELDKRKLAKAIEVIIPILIESNRVVSSMSESYSVKESVDIEI